MTLTSTLAADAGDVTRRGRRAVVLGGGMAGLLAARVLSDAFGQVTIVERDPWPGGPTPRDGTPQAAHVHVLLEAGRIVLEELFPGFEDAVHAMGGVTIDAGSDLRYFQDGAFLAEATDDLPMLCASRPTLEHVVRTEVQRRPGVTIRAPCTFRSYLHDRASNAVVGIELADESGDLATIEADLVVDATGRASRTPGWLESEGYPSPPVDDVSIDLAYSSVRLDRPAGDRRGFLVAPSRDNPRGGAIIPIDGEQWLLTLFGLHGRHPPAHQEGLRSFAEQLPTPVFAEFLGVRRVVSDSVDRYLFPSSRWHHYEAVTPFPAGLLVIGDAVASFNPIYGQGMSVAALSAAALRAALADEGSAIAGPYVERTAALVSTIWRITVSVDFDLPETTGPTPRGTRLVNWYLGRVIAAAHTDGDMTGAFARVMRLESDPRTLLHPRVLARVLRPF